MAETKMDINAKISRNSEVVYSDMDDHTVMMSIEKGEYYDLNPVGRRVWELLETPEKVVAICERLVKEFNVSKAQCELDLLPFLQQLIDKDIITITDE